MKKILLIILAEIALLVTVFACLKPVLGRFNIYDEDLSRDHNTIHIRMLDEPDKRSYGNEMRILYVKANGKNLDLQVYDTADWVWHGEWGYTLFTSGDHDYYIDIDEKLQNLDFCYIKQEGSGKCEVYLNDHLEKKLDMFSAKWKNGNLFVSFLSRGQMIFRGIEIWILLSLLIWLCCKAVLLWTSKKADDDFKIGIGTFNITKGLGICFVVLIHSGLCILTDADIISGSFVLSVLFIFLTYGLMPTFFILGGFGRKTKRTSDSILGNLKEMIVPYVIISVLIILADLIKVYLSGDYGFADPEKDAFSLAVMLIHDKDINGEFYRTIGPLWFTTSFALGSVLLSLLLKIKKDVIRYISVLVLLVFTWFLMSKDFAFFCITTGLMAALYMFAGHLIYSHKQYMNNKKVHAVLLALLPVVILLALLNGTTFAISGNNMGNTYILGFVISVLAAVIYIRISLSLNDSVIEKINVFGLIGRYSYHIFFAHALEYMIIPWGRIAEYLPGNKAIKIILIFIMRVLVIALITAVFSFISRRKNSRRFDRLHA